MLNRLLTILRSPDGPRITEILKLIGSVLIIITVAAFFYDVTHPGTFAAVQADRYGCLGGQPPAGATLVFIDRTDPYSTQQITAVTSELRRISASIQPGELFTIASIGEDLPALIEFRACSPEKGDAFSLLESLRRPNVDWLDLKHQYEEKFEKPIQKLTSEMPLGLATAHSPIIQSISGVITQLGSQWDRVHKRRLTVISDLMENTQAFSHYRPSDNQRRFADARRQINYIRDTPLDLRGVAVTVFYVTGIPHDRDLQGLNHQRFWRDFIAFYGGDLVDWVVVPQGQLTIPSR